MAESLDEPLGVVPGDELADDPAHLRERLEAMEIEALLLERPHEPLNDVGRRAHAQQRICSRRL